VQTPDIVALRAIMPPPPALVHPDLDFDFQEVFVGPPGSGASVHNHEDAINVLLHGRKTWILFPPPHTVRSYV
jgi:hypothetical protein